MAYISLYRKYRSQSFGEVMGQQHITTVLQNAIRMGRIAHAYLFCGPRGCGKTSSARLLARAINCQAGDGPTPEPCGVCSLCERIRNGSSMDVIEMDAASETGIDDVREKIIENAKFAPAEARFKVYIIDEVHDLSLKAFDSLLKTIEEPPAHVVFILATTEAHKVPITVRSRCQRMDFRRGTLQDLMANLTRVLESEKIEFETEAVAATARAAEGSFRDSLSLLEQALAYTDGKLTADAVHASVGTVGAEVLDSVVETIASDDLQSAFLKAGELVETGKDVKQTLIALQLHLRDMLVASTALSPQALPEVSAERFGQLKLQASRFKPAQILQMLDILAGTERDLRFTNQHRLLLERAFWSIIPSSLAEKPAGSTAGSGPQAAQVRPEPAGKPSAPAPVKPERSAASSPAGGAPEPASEPISEPSRFAPEIDVDGLRRLWPRVIKTLTRTYPSASAVFSKDVQVVGLAGNVVQIGFPGEFEREKADRPNRRAALESALATELGGPGLKVKCVLLQPGDEVAPPTEDPAHPLMGLLDGAQTSTESSRLTAQPASAPPVESVMAEAGETPNGLSSSPAKSAETEDLALFVEMVKKELDCVTVDD
jgi:DNA polymerase III subunit gamma/tau